jgi:uncharacterized protein YbcI
MKHKSRQEIESAVSEAMTKFLKEQMGERATCVITEVASGAIIVRFKGIMPPAERYLIKDQEGMKLIKELKERLIERAKPLLEAMIKNLIGAEIIDTYSSFNPKNNEYINIFTLDKGFEDWCNTVEEKAKEVK